MLLQEITTRTTKEVVGAALAEIKASSTNGRIMPEEVVATAAHPDSELHRFFQWDDSEAAEKYRLMQARSLIRSIPVSYIKQKKGEVGKAIKVRKYVALGSDFKDGGGYRDVGDVVANKNLLDELELQAKRELDGMLRRYEVLTELCSAVRSAAGIGKKKR